METGFVLRVQNVNLSRFQRTRVVDFSVAAGTDASSNAG